MDKDCLYCHSDKVLKNGVLPRGGQRYTCKDCHKHLTIGGKARGTYDKTFKENIINMYCHLHMGARVVAKKCNISTSTLVGRGKTHKKTCKKCQE